MSNIAPAYPRAVAALLAGAAILATLSGCERPASDATAPPAATKPGAPPAEPAVRGPDEPADAGASMRYRCEGGWNVAVIGDTAQVTADDGRVIELQRMAHTSPPLFAGEALEFSVDGDGAVLGQDEGGPYSCEDAG